MSIYEFVREQVSQGNTDLDDITRLYLEAALASEHPEVMLREAVRHSVGSNFWSIQAALRRSTSPPGHRGGPAVDFSRTAHNNTMLYNPSTRKQVRLGQARVSDFRAAIRFHELAIAAHQETIMLYQGYIRTILENGVSCLDEIGEQVA